MIKKLLLGLALAVTVQANAIIWHYDNINTSKKTCRVSGWSGSQPSSGKLTIPSTYTHTDGNTYTVTTVASHALDNLTTVTEIVVPASIKKIGEAEAEISPCYVDNFDNCPKLKKFTVDAANKVFSVYQDGILFQSTYHDVLKVPQAYPVTDGKLTLDYNVWNLSREAFTGNSTVKTLSIYRHMAINQNGGLNKALNLATYELNGTGVGMTLHAGVLIDDLQGVLSCPPATTKASITLPSTATKIAAGAFRNCKGVAKVNLNYVTIIDADAFNNSGLQTVSIPAALTELGYGIFANCQSLENIAFAGNAVQIPRDFARDCKALKTVTSTNPIATIAEAAFKNCTSLSTFPFSGATDMSADSIFYGCDFTSVIYEPSDACDGCAGGSTFAGNRNLVKIDASAINTNNGIYWGIGEDFAGTCKNLKEVIFPAHTSFWGYVNSTTPPAFGYSCVIDRIVAHSFWNSGTIQFCYSTSIEGNNYKPKMYIAVGENIKKRADYNAWEVGEMFAATNGATVNPQIYVDAYEPSKNYMSPLASYFIPGGAGRHYGEAKDAGCSVQEMYAIKFIKNGLNLKVEIDGTEHPEGSPEISDFTLQFDDETPIELGTSGQGASKAFTSQVKKVYVSYTVDGIKMLTIYPDDHWMSGIADVAVDAAIMAYKVYNVQGIMVVSGEGAFSADSVELPAGVYIIVAELSNGDTTINKITL